MFLRANSADYCEEQNSTHHTCKCSSTRACTSPEYCFSGRCVGNDHYHDIYNYKILNVDIYDKDMVYIFCYFM